MTSTTVFWLGAFGLALLAGLLLLPARTGPGLQDRRRLNLRLRREQLAALDGQLAANSIDATAYEQALAEIERGVLEEVDGRSPAPWLETADPPAGVEGDTATRPGRAIAAVATAVALFSFGWYGFLGHPAGIDHGPAVATVATTTAPDTEPSTAAVETMLDTLSARMAQQRDGTVDAAGWAWVARSYASLQRFESAGRAYARALALTPDDAQLLADQADVMSMLQERHMAGEPARLAALALRIDPSNLKALALAGNDAFERRDFAAAREHWSRAVQLSPPGEFARRIAHDLASLRAAQQDRPAASAPAALDQDDVTIVIDDVMP